MTVPMQNLVTLTPVEPAGEALRFHLVGDDDPAGGVGGWEVVARPRQRGAAEWTGVDPWTLTLPLVTTGLDVSPNRNASVEAKCRALVVMAMRARATMRPPVLEVTGPVRVPFPGMRWVITGLEWGAQVRDHRQQRVQQHVTVHLLEYVTPQVLLGPAAAARARLGL